jgi:membrane protease YdiL (CAAX protease family)
MSPSLHTAEQGQTNTITSEKRSPYKFFLLVFALSIPLWLIGSLTPLQLLPGLPVSSLMIIVPVTTASILVYRESKSAGVVALLKRSFDYRRIGEKVWYIPVFLLMPGVMALSYGLMRWMGTPVPPPQFSLLTAMVMFIAFFIAGLGEELGWLGYAYNPLEQRYNALKAGMLLGLIGSTWHVVPLLQADRSPAWIAWWYLYSVSLRILTVWIFNNTGKSIFAAAIIHSMINLGWQLFPIDGSYFDPRITGLILAFVVVIVTLIWGPQRLTRSRGV